MEVLSDLASQRQYLSAVTESNYESKGSESFWEPSFPQVVEPHSSSMHVLDVFGCYGSSNCGLSRDMAAKPDVVQKGKTAPPSKVQPLACRPHIKKLSRGGWKPSANNILKKEIGTMLNQRLVHVRGVPIILKDQSELSKSQICFSNNVIMSPSSDVVHKQNSEDHLPMQSSIDLEFSRLYWDSALEQGDIAHSYARSPVDSSSVSLISSESSTCKEVLGSSELQLMDTLFDQSLMMGYGTETWLDDPLMSIAGIHSYTNDGVFINDPNKEDLAVDVKEETSTFVYEGIKAAHSQRFLGSSGYHLGNKSVTLPLNESNEMLNCLCPRIDFEDSSVQSHNLAQEGKILIQDSTPSGCTQNGLPSPLSGSSTFSFTQNLHVTDGFHASPTTFPCASGSKSLARYTDVRQRHESSGVKSSCSYASKGDSIQQMLKPVNSEDSKDAFCSSKIVDLGSSLSLECRQFDTRFKSNHMEIGLACLLTAAAEAVARGDIQLASVILVRLKDMNSCSDNTMQRVVTYFIGSLECLIQGVKGVENRTYSNKTQGDVVTAFQILHEIFPYIKFGHFTANQAILEAVQGASRVHVVDFDILEGIQWPAFMQALVSREGDPPKLRITALCWPKHNEQGVTMVRRTCKRLSEFAATMGLPFSYNLVAINDNEGIHESQMEVVHGEALVVNCMLHLPHMPQHITAGTVASFLCTMRKFSPCIVTLVEEELGCGTTASFCSDALYHFHAICDSLEACLPSGVEARMLVERVYMAPRIHGAIYMWSKGMSPCSAYRAEVPDKYKWSAIMYSAGFRPLSLSSHNQSQARLLLGLYREGFKLEERNHHLVLGWQQKPLYSASIWS